MEAVQLPVACKVLRGIGMRLEAFEKITKAGSDQRLQQRAVPADEIAFGFGQSGKAQAVAQAACLCPPGLIGCRIVPQDRPQNHFGACKGNAPQPTKNR